MAVIGSLSVKLGLVTVEWDQATAKAKKEAKDLQKAFNDLGFDLKNLKNLFANLGGSVGISLAGFGAMIASTIKFADEIDDLSKGMGLTVAKTLQFRDAITQSGGKAESATRILGTLFSKIDEARDGNEATISLFQQMGISFEELKSMTPDQSLNRVAEALSKIGSKYEQVRLLKELFGKSGLGLELESLAKILGQTTEQFNRSEKAIQTLGNFADALQKTMDNLRIAFAELLAPFVGEDGAVIKIETFKAALIGIGSAVVVNGVLTLVAAFKALNTALKSTAALSVALSAKSGLKGAITVAAGVAAYLAAKKIFDLEEAEKAGEAANEGGSGTLPSGSTSATGGTGSTGGEGGDRAELRGLQGRLNATREAIRLEQARNALKVMGLNTDKLTIDLAEIEIKRLEDINKAESAREAALAKRNLSDEQKALIQKQYQADVEAANKKAQGDAELILATRQKELTVLERQKYFQLEKYKLDAATVMLDAQREGMTEKQFAFAQEELNLQRRLLELNKELSDAKLQYGEGERFEIEAERIRRVIDAERQLSEIRKQAIIDKENQVRANQILTDSEKTQFNTMVGNLQSLGQHSKAAFNAWKAMAIAQTIIDTYSSAVASYKALAGIPIVGPALGFTAAAIAVAAGMARVASIRATQYQGKAKGGVVSANQPYLVGENGPEMVVPNQSSMVVPTDRTAGLMGGQPQVVYNGPYIQNMQAIDTQSAAQFLARNKESVYAANLSASRSIPQSR